MFFRCRGESLLGRLIALLVVIYLLVKYVSLTFFYWTFGILFALALVSLLFTDAPPEKTETKNPKRSRTANVKKSVRKSTSGTQGHITTGLVIAEPWISKIIDGTKVWEMRSRSTTKRERIALIRKSSSCIVGLATISGVFGPLSDDQLTADIGKHHVPIEKIGKWRYAWQLTDIVKLDPPIRYVHSSGAVIFATLDAAASEAVSAVDRAES